MTLRNPHYGWEGELLAAHLLSRMSFVARPMSVPDDQGSDFFCTLFEVVDPAGSHPRLQPKNSFAIQVKTSNEPEGTNAFNMTRSIRYLEQLHLPFFIGKVTLAEASLEIYSAEFLPLVFSLAGIPRDLRFAPTRGPIDADTFVDRTGGGACIWCPLVGRITAGDPAEAAARVARNLESFCDRALKNLASRLLEEHVYDFRGEIPVVMAGSGSYKHFRVNFCKRLAEVFANFTWGLQSFGHEPPADQLALFESVYTLLSKCPEWPAWYAAGWRERLSGALSESAKGRIGNAERSDPQES